MIDVQGQSANALDATVGVYAVTSPIWLQMFTTGGQVVMWVGGFILLVLRIRIAWLDWRARKRRHDMWAGNERRIRGNERRNGASD